jgi:hypothetical protein
LPPTKLLKNSKELNIWFRYLAPTSVERKISDVDDRGTRGYRRKRQESCRSKIIDMLGYAGYWLCDEYRIIGAADLAIE